MLCLAELVLLTVTIAIVDNWCRRVLFYGYIAAVFMMSLKDFRDVLCSVSALTLLVGRSKGIRSVKNGGMVEVSTG